MNSFNFNSDEFKKQVLESEGLESDSYELIDSGTPQDNSTKGFQDIISGAPAIPKSSKGIKNIIRDASILEKSGNLAKAEELNTSLCEIITKYNKEYGTNLEIDFSDISRTLVNVSDPRKTRVLELYLSNVFQSIRPVLYLHMISKLALLIDYVLDPQRLTDGTLTYSDQFICVEKILSYITTLESLRDEILIKGADLELKKIGEQEQEELKSGMTGEDQEAIDEFMRLFKKDKEYVNNIQS